MAAQLERPNNRVHNQRRVSTSSFPDKEERRSSNEVEEEDDDAELEELVERSVRRFIGIGASQSAHANLALLVSFWGRFESYLWGKLRDFCFAFVGSFINQFWDRETFMILNSKTFNISSYFYTSLLNALPTFPKLFNFVFSHQNELAHKQSNKNSHTFYYKKLTNQIDSLVLIKWRRNV